MADGLHSAPAMQPRGLVALALGLACWLLAAPGQADPERVSVILSDADNLQYLAFWVAQGSGALEAEGIRPDLVVADTPAQTIARVIAGDAPVAVLPPPVYLQLIADRFPIVLVANLLRNDPINVAVRRSVFEARAMNPAAPLEKRIASLHGLRVCVAPGPPPRLRALFTTVGLDADRDVQMVIRRGPDQNEAFARGDCDVLFAHTPYLEKALDDQDAVMLVNQSAGEVPALAMRQIHALAVRRDYLEQHRERVAGMVRAIARAEQLVQSDPTAAEDAVVRALPSVERRHLHTIFGIYRPAVPPEPHVSIEGLAPALALFPASRVAPSLDGVPLADFVADAGSSPAPAPSPPVKPPPRHRAGIEIVAAGLALLVGIAMLRRRRTT